MWKIFEAANGYYVAMEDDQGFHRQPADNGAAIGWNAKKADAELRRRQKGGK